jgi:hypothetical protein
MVADLKLKSNKMISIGMIFIPSSINKQGKKEVGPLNAVTWHGIHLSLMERLLVRILSCTMTYTRAYPKVPELNQ